MNKTSEILKMEPKNVTRMSNKNHQNCEADCLCQLISKSNSPDKDNDGDLYVDEIYHVLGRDILKSSLLDDIDLYLECDEDSLYVMPPKCSEESVPKQSTLQDIAANSSSGPIQVTFQLKTQGVKKFECEICSFKSVRESLVKDHKFKSHGVKNSFSCSKCSYVGNVHRHLQKHVARAHSQTPVTVKDHLLKTSEKNCDKIVKTSEIKNSSAINNSKSDNIFNTNFNSGKSCAIVRIGENSKNNSYEINSSELHSETTLPSNKDLISDENPKSVDTDQEKFKHHECMLCPYKGKSNRLLKAHIFCKHNIERPTYHCDQCPRVFKQWRSLLSHQALHVGKTEYICEVATCRKTFANRDAIRCHMLTHKTQKMHNCPICDLAFRSESKVKAHVKDVHGEKIHICKVVGCGKKFTTSRALKAHFMVHTTVYQCSWPGCARSFRDKHNLKCHMCTHTGNKPLSCALCDYTCVQRNSLNNHVMKYH